MTEQQFLERVAERAPLHSRGEARPVVRAALRAFGRCLSRLESEALASELPAELRPSLTGVEHGQPLHLADLREELARDEQVRPGFATEHLMVVAQTVAESASDAALERIRLELPGEIAELFHRPEFAEEAPVHAHPERRTLAEGSPGSSLPVAEATADRAQSESVARAANPHADTKLSSAHGLTQEREHESLADGEAGSSRPLYRGRE